MIASQQPTFAELYSMAFSWDAEYEFRSVECLIASSLAGPKPVVIDAGAGTGRFIPCLLKRGITTIAVEPDSDMRTALDKRFGTTPHHSLTVVQSAFESYDPGTTVDAVLALTDTLSYVFPRPRLLEFIANASTVIRPGGVLVVDVGIWTGYEGEGRSEQWATTVEGWTVEAQYTAQVTQIEQEAELARKVETLKFRASKQGCTVERSQQREVHAFSEQSLVGALRARGFELDKSLEPGSIAASASDKPAKRKLFGFVNRAEL